MSGWGDREFTDGRFNSANARRVAEQEAARREGRRFYGLLAAVFIVFVLAVGTLIYSVLRMVLALVQP